MLRMNRLTCALVIAVYISSTDSKSCIESLLCGSMIKKTVCDSQPLKLCIEDSFTVPVFIEKWFLLYRLIVFILSSKLFLDLVSNSLLSYSSLVSNVVVVFSFNWVLIEYSISLKISAVPNWMAGNNYQIFLIRG